MKKRCQMYRIGLTYWNKIRFRLFFEIVGIPDYKNEVCNDFHESSRGKLLELRGNPRIT